MEQGEDGEDSNPYLSRQSSDAYQLALRKLGEGSNEESSVPSRLSVVSLIAAKRRSLKTNQRKAENPNKWVERERTVDDENPSTDAVSISDSDSDASRSSDNEENSQVDDANYEMGGDILKTVAGEEHSGDEEADDGEDLEEAKKAAKFFESHPTVRGGNKEVELFAQLPLSRPVLRGIAAMGYVKPTPIQSAVIPVALAGRDVCASANTGSGKTASFLLPILEKLLFRPSGRTRVLIVSPTRELSSQTFKMASTLAQFTNICTSLIVGGAKNVSSQIAELRARPQIVVCTPGRMLDHVLNSPGVTLENVEFLVFDEADRLLDLGFQDEIQELITACPLERQTLLFSATMGVKVDDLIKLSLKRPVRIRASDRLGGSADNNLEVASRLVQEFIRIRSGNEGINREAILLALLTRTFSSSTIVFTETKAKAHRLMILCGLCGLKCVELHGNLTQPQRLEALEQFQSKEAEILIATDLAARGLDITRVKTVVNFEMPMQVETYIHRIGRTARAGRSGRSVTLISEGRRHLMKAILKDATQKRASNRGESSKDNSKSGVIRSRSVPSTVVSHFASKIKSLEPHVEEVIQAEAVAKMDRIADIEALKAQNLIEHSGEIMSRPQRQWFASSKEKDEVKKASAEKAKTSGLHRMTRKKRRAREAMQAFEDGSNSDDGESRPSASAMSIKSAVRARKKEKSTNELARLNKSVYDMDIERAIVKKKVGVADSLGDSSIFSEEKIAYSTKQAKDDSARAPSRYASVKQACIPMSTLRLTCVSLFDSTAIISVATILPWTLGKSPRRSPCTSSNQKANISVGSKLPRKSS